MERRSATKLEALTIGLLGGVLTHASVHCIVLTRSHTIATSAFHSPLARFAAGLAISGLFVAFTISRVDGRLLEQAWANVWFPAIVLAILLSLVEIGLRAERWRQLLLPFADVSYATSYGLLSIGHLANAVLPARLGDVARAVVAGPRIRVSRASVFGTVAVERVADASLLAMAALIGMIAGYQRMQLPLVALAAGGIVVVIGFGIATAVLNLQNVATTRAGRSLLFHGKRFLEGAGSLRSTVQVIRLATLTLGSFALATAILYACSAAVGLALPLWQSALITAVVTLSTAIPAGPASLGTYEFVGVSIMTSLGYPAEESLLAVASTHAVVVATPATVGLFSLWAMGISPRSSRFGSRSVEG